MIDAPNGFYEMVRGFDVMQGVCDQIGDGDGDAKELDMSDAQRVTVGGISFWSPRAIKNSLVAYNGLINSATIF